MPTYSYVLIMSNNRLMDIGLIRFRTLKIIPNKRTVLKVFRVAEGGDSTLPYLVTPFNRRGKGLRINYLCDEARNRAEDVTAISEFSHIFRVENLNIDLPSFSYINY